MRRSSDGEAGLRCATRADVAWRDVLEHETENIGAKTAVEIQIELT
jgi:hypothetical protein